MSGLCATCKFWKTDKEEYRDAARRVGMHECLAILPQWEIENRPIDRAKKEGKDKYDDDTWWTEMVAEELEKEKAVTQDGSDYCARIITAANFGCVKHDAK
jgi:hypothetical protein